MDNQIWGIFPQNGGSAHPTDSGGWGQPLLVAADNLFPKRFFSLIRLLNAQEKY
jgi:hypothetical protein